MSENNMSNHLNFEHHEVAEEAKNIILIQEIFSYLTKKYRDANLINEEVKIKQIISQPHFLNPLKELFKNGFNPTNEEDKKTIAPYATSIIKAFQKQQIEETNKMLDERNQEIAEKYQTKKNPEQKNIHE